MPLSTLSTVRLNSKYESKIRDLQAYSIQNSVYLRRRRVARGTMVHATRKRQVTMVESTLQPFAATYGRI